VRQILQQRLDGLSSATKPFSLMEYMRCGIEKEGLRITPAGFLAEAVYPQALGSKLCNPVITTDYSEALLEFITPALNHPQKLLNWLQNLHQFTYKYLDNEVIWPASIPQTPYTAQHNIPIADYGTSTLGKLKTIYRRGLGMRYGKEMQTIAGVHFNLSFSDPFWQNYQLLLTNNNSLTEFKNQQYLHLMRNIERYSWLLIYLTGASPFMSANFLSTPFATSLRSGDHGYQTQTTVKMQASLNSLEAYTNDLYNALTTEHPAYAQIGLIENNEYIQLNTNILQLESEYYARVRAKRNLHPKESLLSALTTNGIEYIELRVFDLNPFMPLGIAKEDIIFIQIFALYALLTNSPDISPQEQNEINNNVLLTSQKGRDPELTLTNNGHEQLLTSWAEEILTEVLAVAKFLDKNNLDNTINYTDSVMAKLETIFDPNKLFSARLLREMQEQSCDYGTLIMHYATQHKTWLANMPEDATLQTEITKIAKQSIIEQKNIESALQENFEEYVGFKLGNQ